MPISTVGMPSMTNTHCQPCQPPTPSKVLRIQPDSGPPITPVIGMPKMNQPVTRPRLALGNQYVRYRMMPGKKPASNAPSSSRTM